MSASVWWFILTGAGVVVGLLVGLRLSKRLSWYLPATSNAELSRTLTETLATSEAYKDAFLKSATALIDGSTRLERYLSKLELAEESIHQALTEYAFKTFRDLPEDVVGRISRDVAYLVHQLVSQKIVERLQTLGSEYVLLRDLSDCEIKVTLSAGYSDWRTLQAALRKVEKFRPATLRDGEKVHAFDESRQFNAYLGALGEALFDLKWKGNLNFQVKEGALAL